MISVMYLALPFSSVLALPVFLSVLGKKGRRLDGIDTRTNHVCLRRCRRGGFCKVSISRSVPHLGTTGVKNP